MKSTKKLKDIVLASTLLLSPIAHPETYLIKMVSTETQEPIRTEQFDFKMNLFNRTLEYEYGFTDYTQKRKNISEYLGREIMNNYTRTYLLIEEGNLNIKKIEQEAYFLPKGNWEVLVPSEENIMAKAKEKIVGSEEGTKIVLDVLDEAGTTPPVYGWISTATEWLGKLKNYMEKNENKFYEKELNRISPGAKVIQIDNFDPANPFKKIETARRIKITFEEPEEKTKFKTATQIWVGRQDYGPGHTQGRIPGWIINEFEIEPIQRSYRLKDEKSENIEIVATNPLEKITIGQGRYPQIYKNQLIYCNGDEIKEFDLMKKKERLVHSKKGLVRAQRINSNEFLYSIRGEYTSGKLFWINESTKEDKELTVYGLNPYEWEYYPKSESLLYKKIRGEYFKDIEVTIKLNLN